MEKKRALVLITHVIQEANLISDKIGILYNKKISESGKVGDLIQKEANEILLSIEFYKPTNGELKEEFGDILSKTIKNSDDINNLLSKIKKNKYINLMTKDKFGYPIFKLIKKRREDLFVRGGWWRMDTGKLFSRRCILLLAICTTFSIF
jgi:ABC-type multidrug transport system ATPase subunit